MTQTTAIQDEGQGQINADIQARQAAFGRNLSKYLGWATIPTVILPIIGWLLLPSYTQFLVFAGAPLLMGAGSGLYQVFCRRNQPQLGAYGFLGSIILAMFIAPLPVPGVMPSVGVGYLTAIMVGYLLLGSANTRWIILASLVALGASLVLTHALAPTWPARIDPTVELAASVFISLVALPTGALMAHSIVTGQEEQFREAQLATLEIEKRIAAEQAQRAQLEQANAEIRQRAAAEQAQRARLETANHEIEARIAAEQEQHRRLQQASAEIEQRAAKAQAQREHLEATVKKYVEYMQAVGDGHLNIRLDLGEAGDPNDDPLCVLGRSLNQTTASLQRMITHMRSMAATISTAVTEIQAATTQQIASAAEQDAAVGQTMTTVEEVRATVTQTANRARSVADAAQESVSVSRFGQEAVDHSIDGVRDVRDQVGNIAQNILMLSERTQQIGEIIAAVNDIADQSKMLSLNASIEAARAGEEGKGFGVVAMEVRQLAEQSRTATQRVNSILKEIQSATNSAVMVTEAGMKGADYGMALIEHAGEAIRDLAQVIELSARTAHQIAASTHQQANGMEQLAAAIASIKQASAQTAASTRQAERSAKDLLDMARQMEQAVARYQL
ncbi:MAG: hypothetical protein JXB47_07735 [Anaerolineae bacterium]|nr:hypothetical protein [Anaerolineae bacterium]